MPNIKHAFVSGKSDGGDTSLVRPSNWNAEHTLDTSLDYPEQTTNPSTPAAGQARVFARVRGGHTALEVLQDNGHLSTMGVSEAFSTCYKIQPGTGTAAGTIVIGVGCGFTASGANTYALPTPATGSVLNTSRRYTLETGTTSGTFMNVRNNALICSTVTGFLFSTTVSLIGMSANQRTFFGLMNTTSAITTATDWTTSSSQSKIGLACSTNTGNWRIVWGPAGSAPTATDLGANFPVNTTDFLRLTLFCLRDGSSIAYEVENITTGNVTTGTASSNLPSGQMGGYQHHTNNTNGTNVGYASTGWYIETDY